MNDRFKTLEEKLNIANTLIEELNVDIIEPDPVVELETLPTIVNSDQVEEVFTIDTLKSDFVLIRNNIMKLISTGQRILDSASLVDVSDMKASTISALSDLQSTLGNNLKLMVDVYKQIAEIEKMRLKGKLSSDTTTSINSGTVNNTTNVIFQGDTSELLSLIKQNQ